MIFDAVRTEAWVNLSHRWATPGNGFVTLDIQMLGHAEAPLLSFEAVIAELIKDQNESENAAILMTQCIALSTYWIFGLYETLRNLKDAHSDGFSVLTELFDKVSAIRMPLAKHEARSVPDFRNQRHHPIGFYQPLSGRVGWQVFDPKNDQNIEIIRSDLASEFLETVSGQKY